jgi:hypothetical protein
LLFLIVLPAVEAATRGWVAQLERELHESRVSITLSSTDRHGCSAAHRDFGG